MFTTGSRSGVARPVRVNLCEAPGSMTSAGGARMLSRRSVMAFAGVLALAGCATTMTPEEAARSRELNDWSFDQGQQAMQRAAQQANEAMLQSQMQLQQMLLLNAMLVQPPPPPPAPMP
jgi:hypothetical protein